jgi:prepilin signal peptidase PulO-like enzyme (type II secretory pathway)
MSGAGEPVSQVLMAVAKVELGRIVLCILATLLGLMALATWGTKVAAVPLILAVVLVVLAVIGAWKSRREKRSSGVLGMLPRVVLAAAGLGIVALLFWLRSRRRQTEALPPPPRPEEIDQLASVELEGERAA